MERRSLLRASDADREHVAERLQVAALEGRLEPDELDERLGRALSARTYGELDGLLADLPAAVAQAPAPARARSGLATRAIMLLTAALMLAALAAAYAPRFVVHGLAPAAHRAGRGPGDIGHFFPVHETLSLFAPAVGLLGLIALCAGLIWLISKGDAATDG